LQCRLLVGSACGCQAFGIQVALGLVFGAALGLLARDTGAPNPSAALQMVGSLFV
jgi:Na+/H+-dicarboxylate symporter